MLSEQELQRRESLKKLIELGINPYPADEYPITHHAADIHQHFRDDQPQEFASVSLAGRIMSKRVMGKAAFFDLKDSTGKIQIYFQRDQICPTDDKTLYNEVVKKHIDIGDFIGIKGHVFRTQMGELTVHVHTFTFLCKALRPLPIVKVDAQGQVHDAFSDPEQRYRMRYVDLVVNPHVKDIFIKRTRIIQAMREYFNSFGYLEVETPILQPIPGGASARPFITHHNALDIPLYLRIANELYLKRLIVGGFEGVYEFAKNFRNEGMDRTHNPEFTGMEIYVAYKDYHWMMQFTENLLEHVAKTIHHGSTQVTYGGQTLDFKAPYPRITLYEAIRRYTGIDISGMDEDQLRQTCHQLHIEVTPEMGKAKLIDAIFGEKCQPHFIQPTFIIDYPVEMSPLCKKHRHNPRLTERFELIVNGKEIANAYSELNDPLDQRQRFEEQLRLSQRGDDEAMFIDHDFLRALEYGMPPTAGLGIGIDRLTMLLTGQTSIQEVLFFPQMKPEQFTSAQKTDTWDTAGIPADWIPLAQEAFGSLDTMRSLKPTQVHQQLNGLRKKKKLSIPALQLSEVESWFTQN